MIKDYLEDIEKIKKIKINPTLIIMRGNLGYLFLSSVVLFITALCIGNTGYLYWCSFSLMIFCIVIGLTHGLSYTINSIKWFRRVWRLDE